ncbi:hypothetical protein CAOG_004843 [Capsaspora owczarzaki ATCC 30864]|uniref:6-phosphofructo-2-kinase domain-containing protein n=2 Tax=Capsaspora owczarzaki (strain ATCC 30864) TaxID=595528 RepID=A0A0D2X3E3_CAPO3|nr:hypothetical protein CAOG_004843 [Capsaspora owczarzaki ATCC 30864]
MLIVMVGLPARGKSYISKKLVSFFLWKGFKTALFNVGNRRRENATQQQDASFFDAANQDAKLAREQAAMEVLDELLEYLNVSEGQIAVYDATNSRKDRRHAILDRVQKSGFAGNVLFLESLCTDQAVIEGNMRQKVENSPDYKGCDVEQAMSDLRARIHNYELVYQPIEDEENISYVKVINLASKLICSNVHGHLSHFITAFLMSLHIGQRPIYLVRSGKTELADLVELTPATTPAFGFGHASESSTSLPSRFTMNSSLNPEGVAFAQRLGQFFKKQSVEKPVVYTSLLPRSVETAKHVSCGRVQALSSLNMLDTGICHGMSIQQIMSSMPEEFAAFGKAPFVYRFPGGESYQDLHERLTFFLLELERTRQPVVVISHVSTLQSLLAYFLGKTPDEVPFISVPQHDVIELIPSNYGWAQHRYSI